MNIRNIVDLPDAHPEVSLGLAFEHGAEPVLVIDPLEDRIIDANPRAAALLGYGRSDLRSMRVSALHPGQLPALIVFSQAALLKGRYWTQALSPRHADGSQLSLEYSAAVLPTSAGQWLQIALHDIVERQRRMVDQEADLFMRSGIAEWQRAERFFQDIERENRLILRAAGEGIYGVNAEGITTFVNPAAERMLGWTAEELVGRDMHATVHHTHADGRHYVNHDCPIYAAFRDGTVHKADTEVFWRKDGTPFHVEYTSTPIRERGGLLGAVIVFRDITVRRESEEQLRGALAEVDHLRERLERENEYLQEEIRIETRHRGIIGRSAAHQKIISQIELVAQTDATVLITGESGTGKELIARAIHEASRRSSRPLIRVNCAAIPRELFESEFFGHVKGAFTGAIRDRIGRFELADQATLFLDEVGEIPLELQGKLLRVLQEKQLERVGEERTRNVDVRIIAATNRSLKSDVKAGRFREDLYYRLDVFPIESVPLRERLEDIPQLAQHALEGAIRKLNLPPITLTKADIDRLMRYDWPGNVRELENVIERAAILASNGRLRISLPEARAGQGASVPQPSQVRLVREDERKQRDRDNIVAALNVAGGRVFGADGAAELLGIRPTTLISRMKAFGIKV
ncbi:sigma 54-interacting transcriptional regulator [Methylocella sp. CPCC 101449]|uniref:sigma 54-interacting transcriptional regulator n=1 Tax=Methylocella sp. CPCC 101449 TaxID=2987531 RepID=UPI00288F394E|nr:sigma 54-interacting transcriptional regulator [Methylocella sp. CPCC 101449]MDT2021735.1 sigma 54-interacting transcriptional regulator [Methylocella sp. CPCC 101449]